MQFDCSKCDSSRSLTIHPEPLHCTQLIRTEQLSDHTVKAGSVLVTGTHKTMQQHERTSNKLDASGHATNCT